MRALPEIKEAISSPEEPEALKVERPIHEFQFFNTRLRSIDFKAIIEAK